MSKEVVDAGLKRCPCGEVPASLEMIDTGQGFKWMNVVGTCCGQWSLEFRADYHPDPDNRMPLAIECWNSADRCCELNDT